MTRSPQFAVLSFVLGFVGGAIALPNTALAQTIDIPITGGDATFNDTRIFVPGNNPNDNRAIVFEGGVPDSFFIRTNLQGEALTNALIQGSTLPTLTTPPGGTPAVGDRGQMLATLTFRGFTANGEPALFNNIPIGLEFQVNQITITPPSEAYSQYRTPELILSETGTIETASTTDEVTRDTPIIYVQFQPGSNPPQDQGTELPASLYTTTISGTSYNASFSTDLTGGYIRVADPPGLSLGSTGAGNTEVSTPIFITPPVIYIIGFADAEEDTTVTLPGTTGDFQNTPVMPNAVVIGVFIFTSVPSDTWVDPPMQVSQAQTTFGFDFKMTPRPVPVGIASRVFPGLVGVGQDPNATFTAITGLPEGIDEDDRYTISVDGIVLGQFGPGDTVRFSDYASVLGDRLINGEGVTQFQVSGIEPGVDASDPTAFPIRLEYSTPTASFEMRAIAPTRSAMAPTATEVNAPTTGAANPSAAEGITQDTTQGATQDTTQGATQGVTAVSANNS